MQDLSEKSNEQKNEWMNNRMMEETNEWREDIDCDRRDQVIFRCIRKWNVSANIIINIQEQERLRCNGSSDRQNPFVARQTLPSLSHT